MSEDKKIILIGTGGEKKARNDGGAFAREFAAKVSGDKALIDATRAAQKQGKDTNGGVDPGKGTTRQQRRQEAAALRKIADEDEKARAKLIKIIHKKAKAGGLPFQVFVQRMMDSRLPNLVEMAKVIRRIK